jgi:hypothetical protein
VQTKARAKAPLLQYPNLASQVHAGTARALVTGKSWGMKNYNQACGFRNMLDFRESRKPRHVVFHLPRTVLILTHRAGLPLCCNNPHSL